MTRVRYYGTPCKDCGRDTVGRFAHNDPVRCWSCEAAWLRRRDQRRIERDRIRGPETRARIERRKDQERRREQRVAAVMAARDRGDTYAAIGRTFGFSAARARDLYQLGQKLRAAGGEGAA